MEREVEAPAETWDPQRFSKSFNLLLCADAQTVCPFARFLVSGANERNETTWLGRKFVSSGVVRYNTVASPHSTLLHVNNRYDFRGE